VTVLPASRARALRVDPKAAARVAAAHQDAPAVGDAIARAAYAQLVLESDRSFRRITSTGGVQVCFTTCRAPYAAADELIVSVRRDRRLEVTTAAVQRERRHPLMSCEIGGAYDRFRAVHDVIGHGGLGVGFDRDGEYAAWRYQEQFHSPLARRALATELHAEHSVHWATGELSAHKGVLLDERLLELSRQGSP
jgi:hypothetical protein